MDFVQAVMQIKLGDKITRAAWNNTDLYACMHEGILCVKTEDGLLHPWTISEADIYARDWTTITRTKKDIKGKASSTSPTSPAASGGPKGVQ